MSQSSPPSRGDAWRLVRLAALRTTLSLAAVFAAYYLIPAPASRTGSDFPWLALALIVFGVVVGLQLLAIVKSNYPTIRAAETLTIIVPVFLLIFARSYLSGSLTDPASFSEPLDKTGALYFTVSCFATVGFGDIVATSNAMRILVTVQMFLDLVMLGVVVKLFASAARRGIAGRA